MSHTRTDDGAPSLARAERRLDALVAKVKAAADNALLGLAMTPPTIHDPAVIATVVDLVIVDVATRLQAHTTVTLEPEDRSAFADK